MATSEDINVLAILVRLIITLKTIVLIIIIVINMYSLLYEINRQSSAQFYSISKLESFTGIHCENYSTIFSMLIIKRKLIKTVSDNTVFLTKASYNTDT